MGGKCSYTLLAGKLCLPLIVACVHFRFRKHRSTPCTSEKVLFTKYLILYSLGVTPGSNPLFRTAGSPPQGSPLGLPGSRGSRGKLLMESAALKLPTFQSPVSVTARTGHCRPAQLCQGAMAVLPPGQSSQTPAHPGAWSPFLLLLPGGRSTKHIFVIPVPKDKTLGQLGEIPTITSVDALDLYYR